MEKRSHYTSGFTLIEVLVVVAIIGILSGAGVSSLNSAIANNRLKDAIVNTRAFVEVMSEESKRLNDSLCIQFEPKKMIAYRFANTVCGGTVVDSKSVDNPVSFFGSSIGSVTTTETFLGTPAIWSSTGTYFILSPEQGLNSVSGEGIIVLRYGSSDRYGAVIKTGKKNRWQSFFSVDGGTSWVTP
jgi:prepilin-type N-terminal cleavage/methylation domain-containing protein